MFLQCLNSFCNDKSLSLPSPPSPFSPSSSSLYAEPPSPVMIELQELPTNKTTIVPEGFFKISVTSPEGEVWKWDAEEYPLRLMQSKHDNRIAKSIPYIDPTQLLKGPQSQLLELPLPSNTRYLKERRAHQLKGNNLNVPNPIPHSIPFIIENVNPKNMEHYFKGSKENVKLGECVFIHTFPGLDYQDTACLCQGVGPNLAVGVISRDEQGVFKGSGLGLFSKEEVESFCGSPREESNINLLISDAFARASNVSIFVIGFYNSKYLKNLENAVNNLCRPQKFEVILNPWRLPEDYVDKPDADELEQYFFEQGCNISVGITEKGKAYFANVAGDKIHIYLDEFAEWKKLKGNSRNQLQQSKDETKKSDAIENASKSAIPSGIPKEEIIKAPESERGGAFSNLRLELIIQTAKDVYNDRQNLTLRVSDYENIENIQKVCQKLGVCIDDLFKVQDAKDLLFRSDRLRKVLHFYCTKKSRQCLVDHIYLYEDLINQILKYSVKKAIEYLSKPLPFTHEQITFAVKNIYPETIKEFIAHPEIKQWFTTEPGKKAALALITSL